MEDLSEQQLFFLGSVSVYLISFWGSLCFLHLCKTQGWYLDRKIQSGKEPDEALVRDALFNVLISHTISIPLAAWYGYPFFKGRGMLFSAADLASPLSCVLVLLLWHVCFDTWFYWAHRCFHQPVLYSRFHKKHHLFMTPVGLAAVYAHPVEDLFVNIGSTFVGPVLFPSHFVLYLIYLGLRFHETIDAHSGYDFEWSPWRLLGSIHGGAGKHDWHHSHQVGNYGGFWFWDWLMGTDLKYKKWQQDKVTKTK
jgi:sterol desaturase/sphingolipid hydroxylase (fatty acid hydroxylase superfamily)